MSDTSAQPTGNSSSESARIFAIVCYGLFIVAFMNGLTAIVGVVLAYIKRDEVRGTIWESHFTNLIRVFWIGLVLSFLLVAALVCGVFGVVHTAQFDHFDGAAVLLPLGGIVGILLMIWYLYHCIRGLMRALDSKAYN
jgi:uncharacterized membrane protein